MVEELKKLISNQEGIGNTLIRLQDQEQEAEIEPVCEICGGEIEDINIGGDELRDRCLECGYIG